MALLVAEEMRRLKDLMFTNIGYVTILVAYDIQLFPLLAKSPRTIAEASEALHIATRPAEVLLATCAAQGLLQQQDGYYSLTPAAEVYLPENDSMYFGDFLASLIATDHILSFESLKKAILSDSSQVYDGKALFKMHQEQITRAYAFTYGMHIHSLDAAQVWPQLLDLSEHRMMLDIGGGSGTHSIGAAQRWPNLQAIVFDLQTVCNVTQEIITSSDMQGRVHTHNGNMWEDPFPQSDLHFYSDVYHNWTPEKGRFLTQKSFDALPSGGRIVLHEILYNDQKTGPFAAASSSATMLLWTEGRQYSGADLTTMLTEVGFTDIKILPAFSYWSIVTGRKP